MMCWKIASTSTEVRSCRVLQPTGLSLHGTSTFWHGVDSAARPVLRGAGYVHLFAGDAQLQLVKRIAEFEQRHARLLAQLPQDVRQKFSRRHAAASEVPGVVLSVEMHAVAP